MTDYGYQAHQAAEAHLDECFEHLYGNEEEGAENAALPVAPPALDMLAPFCGCQTCVVREVLNAAWPSMLAAAREEVEK